MARRRTAAEREASAAWKAATGPCEVCRLLDEKCEGPVQGHHIISQQALRKRGLQAHLWDTRNKLDVCERAHRRHTNRVQPIPMWLLPVEALDFADEHGLGWWLERMYPERVAA